jgi:hypothetical protein
MNCTVELRLILNNPGFPVTFPVILVRQVDLLNLVLVINRGFIIN